MRGCSRFVLQALANGRVDLIVYQPPEHLPQMPDDPIRRQFVHSAMVAEGASGGQKYLFPGRPCPYPSRTEIVPEICDVKARISSFALAAKFSRQLSEPAARSYYLVASTSHAGIEGHRHPSDTIQDVVLGCASRQL